MTENPNNFFDDLERRLVAATADRPRRLRRARNRSIATLCTVLIAVLAVGGGLAAALSNSTNNNTGAPAARHHTPAPAPAPSITTRSGPTPTAAPCPGPQHTGSAVGTAPDPGSIVVAVLNGTTVPGLGKAVAMKLERSYFRVGIIANAPEQDRTRTQVYYARAKCIAAATEVASAISLKGDFALQPMTRGVATIAGRSAEIVVVVGSDQNQTP